MDTAAYLQSYGWEGTGFPLDKNRGGHTKPTVWPQKYYRKGLEVRSSLSLRSTSLDPFFENLWVRLQCPEDSEESQPFSGKPPKEEPHKGFPHGLTIAKRPALYVGFAKPKVLEGTISRAQIATAKSTNMVEEESIRSEAPVEVANGISEKKSSKKRKHREGGSGREQNASADDDLTEVEIKKAKKRRKHKAEANGEVAGLVMNDASITNGDIAHQKEKKEKKKRHKAEANAEDTNFRMKDADDVNGDERLEKSKKQKKEKKSKKHDSSDQIVSHIDDQSILTNGNGATLVNGVSHSPVSDVVMGSSKLDDHFKTSNAKDSTSVNGTSHQTKPVTPTSTLGKPVKKVRFKNDMLPPDHPQNYKTWRAQQQLRGSGMMNPDRLAMINAAPSLPSEQTPSEPVPSGPIVEGTDRRQWVIKDFLPFVKGSEWSRRRAERRGRPIRRSPRSIRKEARELMQERMIRDAIERGEEPPKFEKPLTRRQLRQQKKAVKKDPAVRALKFQHRKLQRNTQRKRNEEVKALRNEGKHDEADELSRKPLFQNFEVGETRKKRKRTGEDDSNDDDTDIDDDDEDDDEGMDDSLSDTDETASSSGSNIDDLASEEDEEEEEQLTPEQRAERAEKRRQRREEGKVAKEERRNDPKTKRKKREERYKKVPDVPPPVLPVPTFKTVTKGIPLPFTKRRGSLKELKMILRDSGLSQEEQYAYIHKALVDRNEAINIKQSRRAVMRRERKKKRGIKKHAKHVKCQQEMAANRREKMKRRAAGEFVETSSEKKKRKRAEKAAKEEEQRKKRVDRARDVKEGSDFIPV